MNPDDLMVGPFAESQKNVSDIAGNFFFSKVFYDSIMKHKEIENEYGSHHRERRCINYTEA